MMNPSLTTSPRRRIVVVGHGMVGHKYLQELCTQLDATGSRAAFDIVTFCEEPRPAYDRVQLSAYFSGATAEDLSLVAGDFFAANDIALHLNDAVVAIDRAAKTVTSRQGRTLGYDTLVLATGSCPFVPPFPGHDRDDCFVYRRIEDLEAITAAGARGRVGAVVGGGLLGLEAAKALKDMGLDTHVVEFAPRLMAVQIDDGGGALLRAKIEELGVTVHTGRNTRQVVDGTRCTHRMEFADGEALETDILLFSAGIRPQDALARQAELALGERGGIVIDNDCRTSDPAIYAIGECALWNQQIFGLVAPGYEMARVAVSHLLGGGQQFTGADMSTKLKLMGVDVASIGDAHARSQGAKSCVYVNDHAGVYKKLVTDAEGKKVLGAVLVGDAAEYGNLQQMMLNGINIPGAHEALILPLSEGGAPALGADALPASATICSCNNVSKGALCASIQAGCTALGELKSATRAGSSCGGCAALVKNVLDAELEKIGVEINNHLCEHFPHSRQELEHLIRVEQHRSFSSIRDAHGSGRGCDICKPAIASILATTWNEHVLAPHLAGLQDTNDYFMANMQKDGTYSVVPRVPGGEITPEKLIKLGEVAKAFKLYTKITGGQRIDLFGAQVHQLPLIWKELVDAGFESGHAYGKAVRTVKSCVGSTWCRYGQQDSVGLSIALEERYRGIRAPHKLKFAVSGCTRECAEAQCKDIGVIATDAGWNLYVAGNGGMQPRHADLFATDLDDATLVRYIDRFLMLYIRTADRLQRTARWLENLDGGLDYAKDVVIKDSLGIGAELEAQMQSLVDSYECEWKKTLEDEHKLKRFRHFVNAEDGDSNVMFVEERGQIRPATADERKAQEAA